MIMKVYYGRGHMLFSVTITEVSPGQFLSILQASGITNEGI